MKNKLVDLNNHLFESLERLMDDDLTDEQLEKEVQRSRAVTSVAKTIIQNSQLALNAAKYANEMGYGIKGSNTDLAPMPAMLGVGKE